MGKVKDRTGQKFNRLTVIKRVEDHIQPNGAHVVRWLCQCECGNYTIVSSGELKRAISCGCYAKEVNANRVRTHDMSKTKLYSIWCAMKSRCSRKNNSSYENYGGRGITVCEEWKNDFMNFYNWAISNGYQQTSIRNTQYTLDRINVNGNYCPDNCRWVNSYIQNNNTTHNVSMKHQERYLGKRIKRGLFQSSAGCLINADVNGAIGIARKVTGNSFVKEIISRGQALCPFKLHNLIKEFNHA